MASVALFTSKAAFPNRATSSTPVLPFYNLHAATLATITELAAVGARVNGRESVRGIPLVRVGRGGAHGRDFVTVRIVGDSGGDAVVREDDLIVIGPAVAIRVSRGDLHDIASCADGRVPNKIAVVRIDEGRVAVDGDACRLAHVTSKEHGAAASAEVGQLIEVVEAAAGDRRGAVGSGLDLLAQPVAGLVIML